MPPTLGLTMIARYDEKFLVRCLESVSGIFDQIVIADTGLYTTEGVRKLGAEIHPFKWIDDFAAARNFSLSKVTTDWWMWLDADDILTPEDHAKLLELKKHLGKADTYLMEYNYAQDEFNKPIVQFFRHRIIRNDGKSSWRLPIHEHINHYPNARESKTNIVVTHKRSAETISKDPGRNIRILRKAVQQDPNDARLRYYFGKELWSEGQLDEAIRVLEDHQKQGDWHENLVNGAYFLALSYISNNDPEKAIEAALRGIKLDCRFAEFFFIIGQIHYDRGHWDKAARFFEIAASSPIPATWGNVMLSNYTWEPQDRLSKCYSEMGNFRKGWEWNELALGHRPNDPRLKYNKVYLEDVVFDRLAYRPILLNLGSGGKPTSGYRNCDLYPADGVDLVFDQGKLPYHPGTVHAIRSEHALEHSPSHYTAEATVKEWARALRRGGRLHLMVPDLDLCCRMLAESEDRPRAPGERWTPKEWYKYTIYGIQKGQNGEPDDGQYHRTGFTEGQLKRLLESNGFEVTGLSKYDGFGTPSLEAHAVQTGKPMRLLWMLPGVDRAHPATRIRRLNIANHLGQAGADSVLFEGSDKKSYLDMNDGEVVASARNADVVIFTIFTDRERRLMDSLRACGVSVVADYCEDLTDLHPETSSCLKSASVIVCCSTALARKVSHLARTVVIPDAYELPNNSFVEMNGVRMEAGPGGQMQIVSR